MAVHEGTCTVEGTQCNDDIANCFVFIIACDLAQRNTGYLEITFACCTWALQPARCINSRVSTVGWHNSHVPHHYSVRLRREFVTMGDRKFLPSPISRNTGLVGYIGDFPSKGSGSIYQILDKPNFKFCMELLYTVDELDACTTYYRLVTPIRLDVRCFVVHMAQFQQVWSIECLGFPLGSWWQRCQKPFS